MPDDKFYSVKDIMLGTREQYMSLDDKLSFLRQMISVYDKSVEEFDFYLSKKNDNDPQVICSFTRRLNAIKRLIINIQKKLDVYDFDFDRGVCIKGEDGSYIVDSRAYDISIKNRRLFSMCIDKILNSDFTNKMDFGLAYYEKTSEDVLEDLIVGTCGIQFSNVSSDYNLKCNYIASEDVINVCALDGHINPTESVVRDMLHYQIPASCLCEYHRELIDSSSIIQKPIEILSSVDESTRCVDLLIEEERNKVVLRRTKTLDRKKH